MSFIVSVGKVDHVFVNPRGMAHALLLRDFTNSVIFQRKCLHPIKTERNYSSTFLYLFLYIERVIAHIYYYNSY